MKVLAKNSQLFLQNYSRDKFECYRIKFFKDSQLVLVSVQSLEAQVVALSNCPRQYLCDNTYFMQSTVLNVEDKVEDGTVTI